MENINFILICDSLDYYNLEEKLVNNYYSLTLQTHLVTLTIGARTQEESYDLFGW